MIYSSFLQIISKKGKQMKQKLKKITDDSLKIYSYLISITITFQFFFNIKPIFISEEIIISTLVISLIIAFLKNFRKK